MSREGKLAKNTLILSIGTILPRLAAFITLPILTACLTKEEFGSYDLITILVSLVLPVATLQIEAGAFRFLIDVRQDIRQIKAIITNILVFVAPVSVVALFVLYFFLPGDMLIRILICLYFFTDILSRGVKQIARGLEKNFDFSLNAIITSFGKVVFIVIFVFYLKYSLLGVVISLLLATLMSFVILSIKIKLYQFIEFSLVDFQVIKDLLAYSWPMVPNGMSMWVMNMSDRLLVTMFLGLSANAVYAVATKIPSIITLAQHTFTMAWQENASIVSKDKDADAYYTNMFKIMFNLTAGLVGLIICATPLLFMLLIRGEYSEAYFQMPFLFIAMFFYSQCAYLGGVYVAYKKTKSVGITTTVAAVTKIVICLASIKWLGLYAASGSTLISFLILLIYRMMDVRKFVRISYDFKQIFIVIVILTIEILLCLAQQPVLNVINVGFGIAVFCFFNKPVIKTVRAKVSDLQRKL